MTSSSEYSAPNSSLPESSSKAMAPSAHMSVASSATIVLICMEHTEVLHRKMTGGSNLTSPKMQA